MTNPWLQLRSQPPYVLDIDIQAIQNYGLGHRNGTEIEEKLIPEPYIGDPETATFVLLLLNPGSKPEDLKAHADPQFKDALFRNLRHEPQEYPFYPLNPAFVKTSSAQWWILVLES